MVGLKYYTHDSEKGVVEVTPDSLEKMVAEDKPCLFACLGRHSFNNNPTAGKQISYIKRLLKNDTADHCNIIVITNASERDFSSNAITRYIERFNSWTQRKSDYDFAPERAVDGDYTAFQKMPDQPGITFFNTMLGGLIRDVSWMDEGAMRDEAVAETKQKLSKLNFFGYSLGTTMFAEAFQGMKKMLANKGYSPDEMQSCLNSMANLSIGTSYLVTVDNAIVPSLNVISMEDEVAEKYGNMPLETDEKTLIKEHTGSALTLFPVAKDGRSVSVRMYPTSDATPEEIATLTTNLTREGKSPWKTQIETEEGTRGHGLKLYMDVDGTSIPASGGMRWTRQVMPSAEVVGDYLNSMVQLEKPNHLRDARSLIEKVDAATSTPELLAKMEEKVAASMAAFEQHFGTPDDDIQRL